MRAVLAGVICALLIAPASSQAIVPATPDVPTRNVNGRVNAIVRVGDTIYIGGSFSSVDGQARPGLAAISAVDGSLTPWGASLTLNGAVNAIVASGSTIYVGGLFTSVSDGAGAHTRHALAAIDLSGNLTSW